MPCGILANIFLVSHILLLLLSSKGSWNKLQNMRNWESIFHIAVGNVPYNYLLHEAILIAECLLSVSKCSLTKCSISLCWHFCVDFRFSKTFTVINSMTRTFLIKKLYKYELVNALFILYKCKIMVFWARTNTKIYHRSSSIFTTSNHGARFQLSNFVSMWILYNHCLPSISCNVCVQAGEYKTLLLLLSVKEHGNKKNIVTMSIFLGCLYFHLSNIMGLVICFAEVTNK